MHQHSLFVLIALLACFSLEISAQSITPTTYTAYTVSDSITIDGLPKEKSWDLAPWSSEFVDIKGHEKPLYNTQLKMLWDTNYLYVYVQMEEPHI